MNSPPVHASASSSRRSANTDHEPGVRGWRAERILALVGALLLLLGFFSDVLSAAMHVVVWTYTGAAVSIVGLALLACAGWRTLRTLGPASSVEESREMLEASRAKARAEAGNRAPRI